ncbi:hypothetical protein V1507DRAFT_446550, partial [Lipomyces tetrasporus]
MVDRPSNELVTTEDKVHTYEGLSSADIHGIVGVTGHNNCTDHERRHQFDGATKATVDQVEHFGAVGKIVLAEESCYEELGFCFPTWKKWT